MKPPFVFKPALLGLSLSFCAFLLLTQNDSRALGFLGGSGDAVFVRCVLAGFTMACILALVLRRFPLLDRSRVQMLASGILLLVCLVITALAVLGIHTLPLLMVLGLLAGIAFVPPLLSWALLYARELPESSLFHAALALVLTALLYSAVLLLGEQSPSFLGEQSLALLVVGLLVLAGGISARHQLRAPTQDATKDTPKDTPKDTTEASAPSSQGLGTPLSLKTLILRLWKPLLSGSISAFIIGLVWDPVASATASDAELSWLLVANLLAPLAAALLVIIAFFIRPRHFSLHIYNDVVMPVAIALLLVLPTLNFEGIDISLFTRLASRMCFALVALGVWTSLAAAVRTLGERPWVVFSFGFALIAASMLGGMYAIHIIGTGGQALSLVLLTLFLVLMVVDFALREKPQGANRERMKEALEHYLQRRCDFLAQTSGLSAREREVFLYLARGYGHVYIAKELYVSENTIRTHVRHIYTKLSINSREELLQLIDSEE